jgi:hypothetical protein
MTGSLTEAQNRLPSLHDVHEAAALLGVPTMDEADRNAEAAVPLQQAAVLEKIADWARLSAKACPGVRWTRLQRAHRQVCVSRGDGR